MTHIAWMNYMISTLFNLCDTFFNSRCLSSLEKQYLDVLEAFLYLTSCTFFSP